MGDHSEALEIRYDPASISYAALVEVFWASHNPHGRSWSRQYQPILFTHDTDQAEVALQLRAQLTEQSNLPVYTEIAPAGTFYPAEDYHQKYRLRNNKTLYQEFSRIYPQEADFIRSTAAARVNGYLAGYGTLEVLKKDLPDLGLSAAGRQKMLDRFRE